MPKQISPLGEKNSSFGLIARIYHSELSSVMRNDCACRIISKLADADAVSILLYDGEKDRLINNGTYIDAKSISNSNSSRSAEECAIQMHMLKYINVYDFLWNRFHDLGIPENITNNRLISLIEEFKSPLFKHFNYRFFEEDLNEKEFTHEFLSICINNSKLLATSQKAINGYYTVDTEENEKFYSLYKFTFKKEEQYLIGPNEMNLSGRLYHRTIIDNDQKIEVYDSTRPFIYHEDLMEVTKRGLPKAFNKFLKEKCGYSLKRVSDSIFNYHYIGIPLWSGNRCLGVIRILRNEKKGRLFHNDESGIGSRVRHATEMLGYFLDQSYAEQFVDDISHDWSEVEEDIEEPSKAVKDQSNRHNRYCSKLRKAINSFGCILRLSNSYGDPPRIVGKSTDSDEFREFVETYLPLYDSLIINDKFNENLAQYFISTNQTDAQNQMRDDFRLIGLSIELDYDNPDNYKAKYYYCIKRKRQGVKHDSEYVRETTDLHIFKNNRPPSIQDYFHQKLIDKLGKFIIKSDDDNNQIVLLKHVLMMDIPALDVDGLITFQNTQNRPFNLMDVRFAYGEMKRFGLEKSKANKTREKVFRESAGDFVHSINNAISISCTLINELEKSLTQETIKDKAANLGILLNWLNNIVTNLKRLSLLNNIEIPKTQNDNWDLCTSISELCKSLSGIGEICKGTKVFFNYDMKENLQTTNLNQNAVLLCIFNMLDNALKYSFSKKNKCKVKDYNLEDSKSPGHVHVFLQYQDGYYIFKVTNWGCFIPENIGEISLFENKLITEKFLKDNPADMTSYRKTIDIWGITSRKGLPTVFKFLRLLNGTYVYKHSVLDSSTTFILKIKTS